MAKFITNIQLNGADETEYDKLYSQLKINPSQKRIYADNSKGFVDGRTKFFIEGNITLQDVNAAVFKASSRAGTNYSFYVMQYKKTS